MKKSKKHLLILGVVFLVIALLFAYNYPFGGNSLSTRDRYIFNHKDQLHLSAKFNYKIIQYHQLDIFSSFTVIEFDTENNLSELELIYAKDDNIRRYESLYDSTSSSLSTLYQDYLPLDLYCKCYTLFVINQNHFTSGYLFQVYFFKNKLYIYYTSR